MLEIEPMSINFQFNLPTSFPGKKKERGGRRVVDKHKRFLPSPQRGIVFSDTESYSNAISPTPNTILYPFNLNLEGSI